MALLSGNDCVVIKLQKENMIQFHDSLTHPHFLTALLELERTNQVASHNHYQHRNMK